MDSSSLAAKAPFALAIRRFDLFRELNHAFATHPFCDAQYALHEHVERLGCDSNF